MLENNKLLKGIMMNELTRILKECINDNLIHMVLSGAREKDHISKIKIRPIRHREQLLFQTSEQRGKQEFHANLTGEQTLEKAADWIQKDFKQLQIETTQLTVTILVSKKGKLTIKKKIRQQSLEAADISHNRRKRYIIEEGQPVPFMIDMGVMTAGGKIVKAKYNKFRQINRFLEFIEDVIPQIEKGKELTILDFGCGKSYLTFAMYYYLKVLQGFDIRIIGLDLKEDVINNCKRLAAGYGYDKLEFLVGDIASYTGVTRVDMVVTLHACDTATDYALEKAVKWGAKIILSVPCCQHELNAQIHNEILEPILCYGLIKERMAALITDALRGAFLEKEGYQVQILEFIDMEHTPKNILIRAVKTDNKRKEAKLEPCMELLGVEPLLGKLLKKQDEE